MYYVVSSYWASHCVYNSRSNDRISTDTQHGTPWFPVAESPSKNTDLRDFNIPKRVFLINACLFHTNLFLQSFTVHTLLSSENEEKNVFCGFENSTGRFLLQ